MVLNTLYFHNFRNYVHLTLGFSPGVNLFYGDNGQGKTNILEAVFLLSNGRSHRTSRDAELIRWGEEEASVQAKAERLDGRHQLRMDIKKGERKKISVNESPIPRIGELFGHIQAVMFSPEDLRMIKDGPQLRRRFLDMELSQLNPAYFFTLQRYNRALKQRNALLRMEKMDLDLLSIIEEQLVENGLYIEGKRKEYLVLLREAAAEDHAKLSIGREKLHMKLQGTVKKMDADRYIAALKSSREGDARRMTTSIGPHRDDILFSINGQDARDYASQGQQRTAVLSLKLAEMRCMKSITGEWPLLMLDDVMSELDEKRREQLLLYLQEAQVFIAGTDRPDICDATVYRIENGIAHTENIW